MLKAEASRRCTPPECPLRRPTVPSPPGFVVREQGLLEGLGPAAGSGGVRWQAEDLQPTRVAQNVFEREELELRGRYLVANSLALVTASSLGLPGENETS